MSESAEEGGAYCAICAVCARGDDAHTVAVGCNSFNRQWVRAHPRCARVSHAHAARKRLTRALPLMRHPAQQVEACFNHSVMQAMSGGRVACSGTLLGGGGAVLAYLQLLFDVAKFATEPGCLAMGGVGQGLHYYILHWLRPRRPDLLRFDVLVLANNKWPLYSVGFVQPHRAGGGGSLVVCTRRGSILAVLHQVGRHADLVQHTEALSLDQLRRL